MSDLSTFADVIAANLNDPRATMRTAVAVGKALALPGVTGEALAFQSSLSAARAAHPDADAETLTVLASGKTFGVSGSTIGRYSLTYRIVVAAGIRTTDADAFRHAWNLAKAGKGKAALKAAEGWRSQPDDDRVRLLAEYALTGVTSKSAADVAAAAKREAARETAETEAIAEGVVTDAAMVTPADLFRGQDYAAIVTALVSRALEAGTSDDLYAALADGQDAIITAVTVTPVPVAA